MRVLRRPAFVDDLAECYRFLRSRSPKAAERLISEVERLIDLLAAFPEMGRKRNDLGPELRSFPVRRFRCVIYYRRTADSVALIRLLHGARKVSPDILVDD